MVALYAIFGFGGLNPCRGFLVVGINSHAHVVIGANHVVVAIPAGVIHAVGINQDRHVAAFCGLGHASYVGACLGIEIQRIDVLGHAAQHNVVGHGVNAMLLGSF